MGKGHTSPSSPSSPHHFLFLPLHPLLPWSRFSSITFESLLISHHFSCLSKWQFFLAHPPQFQSRMTKFSRNFWSPSVPRFASLDSSHRFLGIHRSKKSRFQSLLNLTLQPYELFALQLYCFTVYIALHLLDLFVWHLLLTPASEFPVDTLSKRTSLYFGHIPDLPSLRGSNCPQNYGFLCQIFERRILRPSLRSTVVLGWEHRKHQTKNEKKHKRKDMQQRCHKWG